MVADNDFIEIKVDFVRGEGDPSRIFRAMAGLIESTQLLDTHLAAVLSTKVRTTLVLQDVETGSLKSKLKTVIEELLDEALKHGETKKIIGHFLLKAKHKIINWCSDRKEIKNREEVKQLETDIHNLAEQSDIKLLPAYAPVETASLLSDINAVRDALSNLQQEDSATFISSEGASQYNRSLSISPQIVRELITQNIIRSEGERILKVKKPDYLSDTMWGFKYAGHQIEAKIFDDSWLTKFQTRQVSVQPGDSLRVVLREEISYGYDSEIVNTHYEVARVLEIIPGAKLIQGELL
ncbi:MAG: DUF1090 domain-containing protein [Sulfuricaulis sp.]|uniref:hypothetical protein n=1 Tax=Sulfuricaulis sp. TaxID=2003553 RepID=UPI0025DABC5E|nr:hypothetical protein [Sulfuricaulis sp.]MCR4348059.1 DUF1090 domain-containing protein [Sulfuricaulis sp.]